MNVGIAYDAFTESFRRYYPDIKVIKNDSVEEVNKYDLVILSGGEDISSSFYTMGHDKNLSFEVNPHRDDVEKRIFSTAINLNKKVLGVCRGHQLINCLVYNLGNNFIQDITVFGYKPHHGEHSLEILEPGIINNCFKTVNSYHHQGISRSYLKVTSMYEGVVESCETDQIITTQFHPEFMGSKSITFFKLIEEWVNKKVNKEKKVVKSSHDLVDWDFTTYSGSSTTTH